ncbi:LOW QUALITY PROTEIN: mini-chromosome maintenance complex-binding protein-like [Homarus americanus]|uniref:LOW QUALITY PROTEIN: mini-chromosome maintenance complex-binding protein-like n=1 Tax=Homarus americanus TaxID=6706 RepID=UPI001C47E37C|nr:LOW QUALITY PROTEIN: mini-chromosome maintenance complex-binding protein-like [Homarus americanus]
MRSLILRLPWINDNPLHHLQPNRVVRFRGMIQDMFDNEFFLETYVENKITGATRLQPGRYKDIAECGAGETILTDSPRCEIGDRLTYYCVPVPGENDWVKQIYQEMNPCIAEPGSSYSTSRNKRCVDEDADHGASENTHNGHTTEGMDSMESEAVECGEKKRSRTEEGEAAGRNGDRGCSSGATGVPGATLDLNFPITGMKGTPCLVKLYDNQNFSLNDIIEVVGILSVDPSLAARSGDHSEGESLMNTAAMEVEEEAAHCPPPSLVPRLHVITAHKLSHTNPLLPCELDSSDDVLALTGSMRETRESLRQVLQEALLGDELAAELLICHLVSSVFRRQDVHVLGKFSLNLKGINRSLQEQQYTTQLYKLISSLVTQSHILPMTLSNMNTINFIPKKDYKANRLVSGLLQLNQHTHLVVDETALTAGKLETKGVENLTAMCNVIRGQTIDYDFEYHKIEQKTNIPVLIVSEEQTMMTSDIGVRLEPKHSDVSAAFSRVEAMLTPDLLQRIRSYLTAARLMDYTLLEDMQKMVQEDFVDTRKNDDTISAYDLHSLLVLARLLAVSCGQNTLTPEVWKSAIILRNERKSCPPP